MAFRFYSVAQCLEPYMLRIITDAQFTRCKKNLFYPLLHKYISNQYYCSKIPKGFEKYYPGGKKVEEKKADSPAEKNDEQPQEPSSRTSQSSPKQTSSPDWVFKFNLGSGGSKKGGKNPFNPDDDNRLVAFALFGALGVLAVVAYNEFRYKEITWKEFVNSYLSRNIVEKLEVVNKKWVRVKLIQGNQIDTNKYWFNIGSVDTFERNLENVQLEMNIEPSNFVPVVYKSEMDASRAASSLPVILILGILFWNMRKGAGMMGGGGARRVGGLFGRGYQLNKLGMNIVWSKEVPASLRK